MKMAVKIGFIGTGGIANNHLRNLANIEGAEVIAFCDLVLERAEEAAKSWNDARAYNNVDQMLDDRKLDAVYLCLPPMAHGEAELKVIERSIPFLVEKPIGLDREVPDNILKKINEKNLMNAVGFQWRYHPAVKRAQEILKEAEIGMALGYWLGGLPKTPWWRVKHLSGGQFVEQTIHMTDTLRYLCGEVTEVYAAYGSRILHKRVENMTAPDVGSVTMKLANGGVATISNSCILPQGSGLTGLNIYTDQGTIEIRGNGLRFLKGKNDVEDLPMNVQAHALEDVEFIKALQTGDRSYILSDYADAIKTHEIVVAANESAEAGQPVKLRV
jgi:predicted dehydrogenase